MIARLVRLAGAMTLVALLVLGLSGLWTDPWLWAYLGVWFSLAIYAIASIGDDLARERFSPPAGSRSSPAWASVRTQQYS